MTSDPPRGESAADHGARWIALAFIMVGALNYGYALALTHLLTVDEYAKFAAGQSLILWASTVAIVSVPWVLAQALARARSEQECYAALRFAKLLSAASGLFAAVVVGLITSRFAAPPTAMVLAISTFVVFMGTTTTGWLQGQERMRALALLYVVENLVKNGAGLLLVLLTRSGATGALAAFGIGGFVMLFRWPGHPREPGRPGLAAVASRSLWFRAGRIAGAQGLVSLFVAVDVVLVALLPGGRALAASYQASATLSRVPLFVAGAVATAFFPSLSRLGSTQPLVTRALHMYTAVTLPLTAMIMTVPARLLGMVFPAQYGSMATLLTFTAISGFGIGGISLITAFFQAADDYSCLKWLAGALAGYVALLLAGDRIAGVAGLAAGGAIGTAAALIVVGARLAHGQGRAVLSRIPLAEPLLTAGLLVVLRPHPFVWLAATIVIGLHAGLRFLRPVARHARGWNWPVLVSAPRPHRPARHRPPSLSER